MSKSPKNKHVISILLGNEAGVLTCVAGLFSARGYNIESLTVAETEDPALSRMTIVTFGADNLATQIQQQLNKLVDVVRVVDLSECEYVELEMLLVKIECSGDKASRERLSRFTLDHHARVLEHENDVCIMSMTASPQVIDAFIKVLSEWRVLEIVRSGAISLEHGAAVLKL